MVFTPCSGLYLPWRTNHPNHRGEDVRGSSAHANFCSNAPEEHDSETRLGWSDDSKFSGDNAWRPGLIYLAYVGAVILAAGLLILGIGLIRKPRQAE
jgi:hypothetical protein